MGAVELDNGLFGIDILGVTHERYQLPFASHGAMDGRQGTQAEMGSLGSLVAVLLKASESGWVLRGSLVMNLTGNPPPPKNINRSVLPAADQSLFYVVLNSYNA